LIWGSGECWPLWTCERKMIDWIVVKLWCRIESMGSGFYSWPNFNLISLWNFFLSLDRDSIRCVPSVIMVSTCHFFSFLRFLFSVSSGQVVLSLCIVATCLLYPTLHSSSSNFEISHPLFIFQYKICQVKHCCVLL